jgi:hypothetical protein
MTSNAKNMEHRILLEKLFGLPNVEGDLVDRLEQRDLKKNQLLGAVEQIVEVVTSISTKVSSNAKLDKESQKVIEAEVRLEASEEGNHSGNSDRKIATSSDKDQFLMDGLWKLAVIRTGNEAVTINKSKNESTTSNPIIKSIIPMDFEELKKIADITARDNQTSTITTTETMFNFELSRDGVPVMTKMLNKVEEMNVTIDSNKQNETSQTCKLIFFVREQILNYIYYTLFQVENIY